LIKKNKLRQFIQVFFVAILFLAISAFSYSSDYQALAEEATSVPNYDFQLKLTAENIKEKTYKDGEFLPDNVQQKLNRTVDKIRDKINLDEPLPQKVRSLGEQVQEKTNSVLPNSLNKE
jgi:hypothetical protein